MLADVWEKTALIIRLFFQSSTQNICIVQSNVLLASQSSADDCGVTEGQAERLQEALKGHGNVHCLTMVFRTMLAF